MRYGDWKREETFRLLDCLGGAEVARLLIARSSAKQDESPKYGELTEGRVEALVNKLDGLPAVEEILAEAKDVQVVEAVRTLFDRNGRRIPPQGMEAPVCDANRNFRLTQPELQYGERLARIARFCSPGTVFPTAEAFAQATDAILARIRGDEALANLAKGVFLPIVLPHCPDLMDGDYGQILERFFAVVKAAYETQFPGRTFVNHRAGELARLVSIAQGTRHEELLGRMAKGPVVGVLFPTALQGYSIPAQRSQMESLPPYLLLSGGIDWAVALAAYADVLARDFNTPGMDASANQWRGAEYSLYFKAHGDELKFDYRYLNANDNYSGGLLALGE